MNTWQERIRKDLVPFANPGTVLDCSEIGEEFFVKWMARTRELTASFKLKDDAIVVNFENNTMSYASFLASPSMSDMLGIASMTLQMHQGAIFVDTKAKDSETERGPESALALLRETVRAQDPGSTYVIFINADAGAGKTEVLKQLVYEQAKKYVRGEADYLYLYVNAQGRALARLDEALATELQDLRASYLTYHVIPTLTRNNIIVPIIDGFDELLGVMGYEDSFSSLRRFLADLNGQGCLIASARSTYYQQEFLSRANKPSSGLGGITIKQIDVQPWAQGEFVDFVEKRFQAEHKPRVDFDGFKNSMIRIFSAERNKSLKTKPFFLAAAATLIINGAEINEDELIDQLVGGFVERERLEKLLDRQGNPLLTSEQIHQFLRLVSDEMWAGEVRFLDRETIRDLADLAFDAHVVGPEVAQILQERAGTMAFFTASSYREGVEFEHQLFFAYFLGESISVSAATSQEELFRTIVRATLPEGAASFAARRLVTGGQSSTDVFRACSAAAGRGSIRPPHLRENAGALIAEYIREDDAEGRAGSYANEIFSDVVFAGVQFPRVEIMRSNFSSVEFRRSDLSKLKLADCSGSDLIFQEVTVDPNYTKLDIKGVPLDKSVFGLRVRDGDRIQTVFRLSEIRSALAQCSFPDLGVQESSGIEENILILVDKLFRKFEKSNVFWPTDDVNRNITQDPNWNRLSEILLASGLAVQERVSASGAPRPHLRVTAPPEVVMLGQIGNGKIAERVENFWSDLRAEWPAP